jgi:UDP-glucose 4-epimerase
MNILVVGGAGYIGTHMVKGLLGAGHNPIILDNLSNGHQDLLPGGTFLKGDIDDASLLDTVFQSNKIDAVMHFASFIEVGESVIDPLKFYQNNVSATITLLQGMLRHEIKRFIFSSTAAVYGEPEYTPIDENHVCNPVNPYGQTKLIVEHILKDCDRAYGLRHVRLRYFNAAGADPSGMIGESHDPESHLIPLIIHAALGKRKDVKIFGTNYNTPDGTCLRDYIHVNDLVSAHLLALQSLMDGCRSSVYNLGNSKGYSVREVINIAEAVSGKKINVMESDRRPGDSAILVADSKKIRSELGWIPKYEDLTQIIQTAWNWHKNHL